MPYVQIHRARVSREMTLGAEEAQYAALSEVELLRMRQMDAYIALRGSDNIFEGSDIPAERVQLVSRLMKPVLDHRVGKTKWVVLRWPTPAMAQQAAMSTEAFEDFYFKVCTLDYSRIVLMGQSFFGNRLHNHFTSGIGVAIQQCQNFIFG